MTTTPELLPVPVAGERWRVDPLRLAVAGPRPLPRRDAPPCRVRPARTYRVTWSAEDEEYVATCLELPSLSWLADTQEDALRGLRELIADVVQDMRDSQEPVPEPLSSRAYSGKFNLRVGERLQRKLAMEAAQEHLSLDPPVNVVL